MPPASPANVTNPIHEALSKLYTQLQKDADTMKDALKPANQQMAAKGTWVGSAADSWASQLDGHAKDCVTQVNAMLSDVASALAAEPAKVTQQEAQNKAKLLAMMGSGRMF